MSIYISSIGTANPDYKTPQDEVLRFMVKAHQLNAEEQKRLAVLYRASGISTRYSVLKDYTSSNGYDFYPNSADLEPFPSTSDRMQHYSHAALTLAQSAVENCLQQVSISKNDITHLITVSCTGMQAPGLDIQLIEQLPLKRHTNRLAINFMGCYAAFNAIKTASAICQSDPEAKVLVVCVELCSLHFQKEKTDDNLLANALFGDGGAALLMQSSPTKGVNLTPKVFHCDLVPSGREEMAWKIGDLGFEMKLSAYVPDAIREGINQLVARLLSRLELQIGDVSYLAVHPGGKKILKVIEQEIGVSKEKNRFAHQVLRDFGNMSSPTILFVMHALMAALKAEDEGKYVLALAFGPGLTLESMLLQVSVE